MIPVIPENEYLNHVQRLQQKMKECNVDVVLCFANESTYTHVHWLTRYWPLFEVGGALVGQTGLPLVLVGGEAPEFAGQGPFGMERVRGCSLFGHTYGGISGDWVGMTYHDIASLMKEVANGSEIKRIAIGDMAIIPHNVYAAVAAAIPGAEVVGFDREMDDLCMNKSAWEASMVRQACLISEKAFDITLGKINPEMTEYELEGVLASELYKNGGEGPSFPILCYSGYRSRCGIGRSTHNKLGMNNMINVDAACHFGGYAAAYGRPFVFGKMSDQMKREVDFLLDVHQKVINEWVKPGVTAGEVYDKYFNYFVDHGFGEPPASASHGIGIFEGEAPAFRRNIPTIIKPGMTIAGDHFLRSANYGMRFEDVYLITETGTELFTSSKWGYIEL